MLKVGLTGSIAVGKTTVMRRFAELGAVCFDADTIARSVVEPGTPALAAIVAEFGSGVLAPDGSLDREALGRMVFGDSERRARLESLLHPPIIAEQDRLIAEVAARDPDAIVIVDAALMVESGGYKRFDGLIVVHCDPELQRQRLMRRGKLSREAADTRIAAQMPQEEKLKHATWTIDTSGTLDDTRRRTDLVWQKLVAARDAL
ncbi:MAG TPA: dephospho-CoA kinase [Blastocatellia bacterium]|nr:dephospho-CoA kinase [Blastocatellia bacterium]